MTVVSGLGVGGN